MEQTLKQRLIGATILISLAVIFLPMLIGHKPSEVDPVYIEIPKPPEDLQSNIKVLDEIESEPVAMVSISKSGKESTQLIPSIPPAKKIKPVEGLNAWVVQVGSFSAKANANALTEKLKQAGFTAYVEQIDSSKKSIYRVKVGPELSRKKADALQTVLLKEQKLPKSIVVQYP